MASKRVIFHLNHSTPHAIDPQTEQDIYNLLKLCMHQL